MLIQRVVAVNGGRLVIVPVRLSSHGVAANTETNLAKLKPEEQDNPGFFQKIALRFKGIPLKGEAHKPKSLFDDCDKLFASPIPLPTVPKDYKEFPERDLVMNFTLIFFYDYYLFR